MRPDGIHTATQADRAGLAELHRRASLIYEDTRVFLLERPDLFGVSRAALDAGRVRVVTRDGHIVAFATLLFGADGAGELEDLFVDPARWGQGLGRALIEDAMEDARAHGIARIDVTANSNALGFYEKLGFVAIGSVSTEFGAGARMSVVIPVD